MIAPLGNKIKNIPLDVIAFEYPATHFQNTEIVRYSFYTDTGQTIIVDHPIAYILDNLRLSNFVMLKREAFMDAVDLGFANG